MSSKPFCANPALGGGIGKAKSIFFLAALVSSSLASATTTPSHGAQSQASQGAATEIAAINERMAVMAARLAELELQARIATQNNEIQRLRSAADALGGISAAPTAMPSILEIGGVDGRLWTRVQMRGGASQVLRTGDRAGDWVVESITIDSVTVRRGRETQRLAFGNFVEPVPSPAMGGALSSMPPGMPQLPL